ncbi:unnamed protein product, partial [Hapterophycus canaliculatus]
MGMTRAFLAAGADVNLRCGRGMSALDWSSVGGHVETVTVLIEHGAEVNAADASGWTALHFGAAAGKAEVVRLLCSSGADVDKADGSGSTPLLEATRGGHAAAARALLGAGADGSLRSAQDETPLHLAVINAGKRGSAEVVDLLLRRGADEKAMSSNGQTAMDMIGAGEIEDEDVLAEEDVERVRLLLSHAPADRAWRRHGFLVMC